MSWLSKIIGYATTAERNGISLGTAPAWEISSPKDAEKFVRALHILFLETATVYLEGTSISRDIQDFLSSRQVANPTKIAMGTIWPKPSCFHIHATAANFDGLAKLLVNHSTAEVCSHFHVYDSSGILLEWYDSFGEDPLYVSQSIAEERVQSFCRAIGSSFKAIITNA